MGATVEVYTVKCKKNELKEKANELRNEARYDHGHSGYSGTIAEDNGQLTIYSEVMTEREAEDHIYENAQKWENSLAIPLGNDVWMIGGCYSC